MQTYEILQDFKGPEGDWLDMTVDMCASLEPLPHTQTTDLANSTKRLDSRSTYQQNPYLFITHVDMCAPLEPLPHTYIGR